MLLARWGGQNGPDEEAVLRAALENDPNNAAAGIKLIDLLGQQKRWVDAHPVVNEVLKRHPADTAVLREIARFHGRWGSSVNSASRLTRAHETWQRLRERRNHEAASDSNGIRPLIPTQSGH